MGTTISTACRVWFTLSHGILNEIYYPRIDEACTRDLELVVTSGPGFFSEEKRDTRHELETVGPGVPAYRLANTCVGGRYRIEKTIFCDPDRDVLVQQIRFVALEGDAGDYRIHALLAPHLGNHGMGNTGWSGDHKGVPMLFAEGHGRALALACSAPWAARTAGFVGTTDAWQDLRNNGKITTEYARAELGNLALAGEVQLPGDGRFVLALGFGRVPAEAGHRALACLRSDPDRILDAYRGEWEAWLASIRQPETPGESDRTSAMVLRAHESKSFPGGIIASLSVPWGSSRGDGDLGGYHLVWPRDLVEAAGGLLALDAREEVRRALDYLEATQEPDGHWAQNMWLDGTPYWSGVQLDEAALPVLLLDLCLRKKAISAEALDGYWSMARSAALYVARTGPVTDQDRWEEDAGYSPYTLATAIAALLAAAAFADARGEHVLRDYLHDTADNWNDALESWTYVTDTELCRRVGVRGYYVRIAPPDRADAASPTLGFVPIKNRPPGIDRAPAENLVSPDALALVRFGLRTPDDPRIVDTVRVIDALLKVEFPSGPCYRRYNGDGYGEHDDGSPFDGTGTGRPWPLLTLERAHFELAAGRPDEARRLLAAVEAFANRGLIPEQVWDGPAVPDRELFPGRPAGSAMPLVWAHAEAVKLRRSIAEGGPFDRPPHGAARYGAGYAPRRLRLWRRNQKVRDVPAGWTLRIEIDEESIVHWSADDWRTVRDERTTCILPSVHRLDLATAGMRAGATIRFTFHRVAPDRWEGRDYEVSVRTWHGTPVEAGATSAGEAP